MDNGKFLIFSDESGCWHYSDNDSNDLYYVRSWIKITEYNYSKICKWFEEIFGLIKCEEIKWSFVKGNFKQNPDIANILSLIFGITFNTFITITIPNCANQRIEQTKTYNKIKEIDTSDLTGYVSMSSYRDNFATLTKEKLLSNVKHLLFMGIYEKYHIENAKKAFTTSEIECEWQIDEPQCTKNIWESIANIDQIKLVKSGKNPGVQLADVIAGCYQDLLGKKTSDEYKKALEFYKEYLKCKQIYKGEELPNPNVVFANDSCANALLNLIKENIWQF